MPKRKSQIYLAGPIHGCNDAQIRRWRDSVKQKYGNQCEFLDPSENLLNQEASPAEVVEADIRAIESADGLLVNMWRESIGAALGVVHAHRRGQPVVVSDPNHLQRTGSNLWQGAVVYRRSGPADVPGRWPNLRCDVAQSRTHRRLAEGTARGGMSATGDRRVRPVRSRTGPCHQGHRGCWIFHSGPEHAPGRSHWLRRGRNHASRQGSRVQGCSRHRLRRRGPPASVQDRERCGRSRSRRGLQHGAPLAPRGMHPCS